MFSLRILILKLIGFLFDELFFTMIKQFHNFDVIESLLFRIIIIKN